MEKVILACAAQTTRFDFLSMLMCHMRSTVFKDLYKANFDSRQLKYYIGLSLGRTARCARSPLKLPCVVLPVFHPDYHAESYTESVRLVAENFARYMLAESLTGHYMNGSVIPKVVYVSLVSYKGRETYLLLSMVPDANHVWQTCMEQSKTCKVLHQTSIF